MDRVTIYLTDTERVQVKDLAAQYGVSTTALIRSIVAVFLDEAADDLEITPRLLLHFAELSPP